MTTVLEERLRHATIIEAIYTPGDLERISGLRADMQRVWRARGQLPPVESGHARFTVSQTVEITFRYAVSKIGIPPSELKLDLAGATRAALTHAVFTHGGCEVIGPSEDVDLFLREFADDDGTLGMRLAGNPDRANYLVLNEWHQTRVVGDEHDLVSTTKEEVNVIFNLALVGARLVERGRKPVVTLRFPDQSGQRAIRRLTGIGRVEETGANDS